LGSPDELPPLNFRRHRRKRDEFESSSSSPTSITTPLVSKRSEQEMLYIEKVDSQSQRKPKKVKSDSTSYSVTDLIDNM